VRPHPDPTFGIELLDVSISKTSEVKQFPKELIKVIDKEFSEPNDMDIFASSAILTPKTWKKILKK
jgi:hypothetical protein